MIYSIMKFYFSLKVARKAYKTAMKYETSDIKKALLNDIPLTSLTIVGSVDSISAARMMLIDQKQMLEDVYG